MWNMTHINGLKIPAGKSEKKHSGIKYVDLLNFLKAKAIMPSILKELLKL